MNREAVLARLHQHQQAVLSIMDEAEPLLRDPAARDVAALARARWAMVRGLGEYQLFKHRRIFDPALATPDAPSRERAARLKQRCVEMGDEFRAYVTRWGGADVAGEWPTYQAAALKMMARLRAHVARERTECEALIGRP